MALALNWMLRAMYILSVYFNTSRILILVQERLNSMLKEVLMFMSASLTPMATLFGRDNSVVEIAIMVRPWLLINRGTFIRRGILRNGLILIPGRERTSLQH